MGCHVTIAGTISMRTHGGPRVVNKESGFMKSAGLSDASQNALSTSPSSSPTVTMMSHSPSTGSINRGIKRSYYPLQYSIKVHQYRKICIQFGIWITHQSCVVVQTPVFHLIQFQLLFMQHKKCT